MKKVVYTMEQAQNIATFLGALTITGGDGCKQWYKAIEAIENPLQIIEEEGEKENEQDKYNSDTNKGVPEHK
jgi:hypothetical protein